MCAASYITDSLLVSSTPNIRSRSQQTLDLLVLGKPAAPNCHTPYTSRTTREVYRTQHFSEAELVGGASFNSAMDKLQSVRRARRQFNLEVCWTTSTKSEHGFSLASNVGRLPDGTSCEFYPRLNVLAIAIFLLVDIRGGKRHRNHNEEGVYGKVHTRTDPPSIPKRICERIPELLCLFVVCWLHEPVRIEGKWVRKQRFIVEDVPDVGNEDRVFREVVTCAD